MSMSLRRLRAPKRGATGSANPAARAPPRWSNWRRLSIGSGSRATLGTSTEMSLEPQLEQPELPQRRAVEVRAVLVGRGEHRLDHVGPEQPAVARRLRP